MSWSFAALLAAANRTKRVDDLHLTGNWRGSYPGAPWAGEGSTGTSGGRQLTGHGALPITGLYSTGVPYIGMNRPRAEYGDDWSGWTGTMFFSWSEPAGHTYAQEITAYKGFGFNIIRLPISWERIQHVRNGALNTTYVTNMLSFINTFTAAGFVVVVDLHNYMRFADGTHNTSPSADQSVTQVGTYTQRTYGDGTLTKAHWQDVWSKIAALTGIVDNPKVWLELMNEPHDFSSYSVAQFWLDQNDVIASIRATGNTNRIIAANTRGSDITHWFTAPTSGQSGTSDSVAALTLTDSAHNTVLGIHAYNEVAGSWTTALDAFNTWARANTFANGDAIRAAMTEWGDAAANPNSNITTFANKLGAAADVWLAHIAWSLDSGGSGHTLVTDADFTTAGTKMAALSGIVTANIIDTGTGSESRTYTPPPSYDLYADRPTSIKADWDPADSMDSALTLGTHPSSGGEIYRIPPKAALGLGSGFNLNRVSSVGMRFSSADSDANGLDVLTTSAANQRNESTAFGTSFSTPYSFHFWCFLPSSMSAKAFLTSASGNATGACYVTAAATTRALSTQLETTTGNALTSGSIAAGKHVVSIVANGASSKIYVDGVQVATGTLDSDAMTRLTLGTFGNYIAGVKIGRIVVIDGADTATNPTTGNSYVADMVDWFQNTLGYGT